MKQLNFTDLIDKSQPRRRLTRFGIFILIGFALLLWSMILGSDANHSQWIPQLLMAIIMVSLLLSMILAAVRRQGLTKCSRQASDFCLLERWSQAAEPLRRLLAKPVPSAQIRYQGLLELAGVAEHTQRLDQADQIYQAIAQEQPHSLLGSLALLGRAIILLKLDQLADADTIIRQLEVSAQAGSLKSLVLLARMYQQIKTGHYAEALENASEKCELARLGLSTKAAYIYALLALAYKRRVQVDYSPQSHDQAPLKDQDQDQDQAKSNWMRATMLLKPGSLIEKFPELAELSAVYKSADTLPGATEDDATVTVEPTTNQESQHDY